MYDGSFMFSVEMLADMMNGNKQYLSKKVKRLVEDPGVRMKAVLKSKKEGYQIPEDEVLRCFDKVSPEQISEYKKQYQASRLMPGVRMLTGRNQAESRDPSGEERLLIEWKVRLAATAPDRKNSPEIREYLIQEKEKIEALREEKMKEYLSLELFLGNCDRMIREIEQRLNPAEESRE